MAPGAPSFQPQFPPPGAAPPPQRSKLAKGCLVGIAALAGLCLLSIAGLFAINYASLSRHVDTVQQFASAMSRGPSPEACRHLHGGEAPTGCALLLGSIQATAPGLSGASVKAGSFFVDFDGGRETVEIEARRESTTAHYRVTFAADGLIESISGPGTIP